MALTRLHSASLGNTTGTPVRSGYERLNRGETTRATGAQAGRIRSGEPAVPWQATVVEAGGLAATAPSPRRQEERRNRRHRLRRLETRVRSSAPRQGRPRTQPRPGNSCCRGRHADVHRRRHFFAHSEDRLEGRCRNVVHVARRGGWDPSRTGDAAAGTACRHSAMHADSAAGDADSANTIARLVSRLARDAMVRVYARAGQPGRARVRATACMRNVTAAAA